MHMRVIISGSKTVQDYSTIVRAIESSTFDITSVLTDQRSGPGVLGYRWALERKIPIRVFRADWDKLGKPAQIITCFEMAAFADGAIVIHDGTDHVSLYQCRIARSCECKVHEVLLQHQQQTIVDYGRSQNKSV